MTKPALKTPISTAVEVVEKMPLSDGVVDPFAADWKLARRYIDGAAFFQRASLASQIMAGFVLLELRKKWGVQQGGDRKSAAFQKSKPHDGVLIFESWDVAVKRNLGVSASTGYRFMDMAKGTQKRLPKGDTGLRNILARYPGMVTPAELELLEKAVDKISNGQTQTEFLLECGITKAPQGSGARGGDMGGGGHVASTAAIADRIREHMEDRCDDLEADLRDRPWRPASDEVRKRYLGLLMDIAAAVREDARESAKEAAI